jgi:hypothetical protein
MISKPACATKIMMIRHAEKPPDGENGVTINEKPDPQSLIIRGWQRAGALAVLFAPSNGQYERPGLGTPQFVYASKVEKHSESWRPQETVMPLTAKLGKNVQENYHHPKGKEQKVASEALTCPGVVLICWEHTLIPTIASYIPISSNNQMPVLTQWPDGRFDVVWVFDLDSSTGKYTFSQVPQCLLAGDQDS